MIEVAIPFILFFALFCSMAWKIRRSERIVPPMVVGVFVVTIFMVIVSFVGLFFGLARA